MKRRRHRKPFSLADVKLYLTDCMWIIHATIHREDLDLGEVCKATHALAQAANAYKSLSEASALEEIATLRERIDAVETDARRLHA